LNSIRVIVLLQWKFFKPRIIKMLYLPFLAYLATFLAYVTFVIEVEGAERTPIWSATDAVL
jgi:hypothetical protein